MVSRHMTFGQVRLRSRRRCPFFPQNAIHIVVVDPGVGSERAAILVETEHGRFIAPDNGVLTSVVPDDSTARAYSLDKPDYWRRQVSATFHGRDVFAR